MSALSLSHVSYVYSVGTPFEHRALRDINLAFTPGKITGLIGHTGSGKSTLAMLLNGLIKPSEGTVLIDGADIWENPKQMRPLRFRVGLVFQYPEYQLFEETVEKDIAFGPSNMGKNPEEIKRLTHSAATFVGLEESLLQKSPFELSGGERRRAAIAGVLAMDTEFLILDEPAAGLDPHGREEILGGLRAYQRAKEKTVILISHSMEDMARYADELVVMKDAAVFAQGSVREIFEQSDLVREAGLELPQITRIARSLSDVGLPAGVTTPEEAEREILELMGKA